MLSASTSRSAAAFDRAGVCLSALCAVHCLALPFLLVVTPAFLATVLAGHEVHLTLAVLLLVIAALAFVPGYAHHRNLSVLVFGVVGVSLISAGAFAEEAISPALERILTVGGSFVLIGSHVANLHLRNRLAAQVPAE